jgi:hypothetical protein
VREETTGIRTSVTLFGRKRHFISHFAARASFEFRRGGAIKANKIDENHASNEMAEGAKYLHFRDILRIR